MVLVTSEVPIVVTGKEKLARLSFRGKEVRLVNLTMVIISAAINPVRPTCESSSDRHGWVV